MKRILLFTFCFLAFAIAGYSQPPSENDPLRPRNPQPEELPKNIRETLAKQRIAREKKDYEDLLKDTEEAAALSTELEKSFNGTNKVTTDDVKRLDKLEKLVRKIRGDLGGSDEAPDAEKGDEAEKPDTLFNAFKVLQSNTAKLLDEVKKSTRYSISVVAIQSSNVVLRVLKFIRIGK